MTKITLRAKNDPSVEITGELTKDGQNFWNVRMAFGTSPNSFEKGQWDLIYELPTKPGTVFRATVEGVGEMRMITWNFGERAYRGVAQSGEYHYVSRDRIDASTVKIELEGWE